jgi:hypothetical protein
MKKRAISVIAGDGSHFISYLAVNFGAHFQEENSTNRDSTFIANIDSGNGSVNMNPFIQWLFAVIYELEVWVTQFLSTLALDLIESPYLAKIGRKCKRQIQSKEHIVCSIPITRVTRAPTQEDTCNCGIYSLINTRAAFLGDRNHHVRWHKVHNAHALWTLVLNPFWELPKKQRRVRLEERITKFVSISIRYCGNSQGVSPSGDHIGNVPLPPYHHSAQLHLLELWQTTPVRWPTKLHLLTTIP